MASDHLVSVCLSTPLLSDMDMSCIHTQVVKAYCNGVFQDLSSHTRVSPTERQNSLRKFISNINSHPEARKELEKWGLSLEPDTIQVRGLSRKHGVCLIRVSKLIGGSDQRWSKFSTVTH